MSEERHLTPTAGETALVALGQGAIMAFGALLALLIAQLFGRNTETDAFFAAYGVYGIGVTFTQSFRLTAVPRLVRGDPDAGTTEMLGATVVMVAGLSVPIALGAGLLGSVLVEHDPQRVAPDTLRILAVALGGQLLASMLTTVLTVRGAFRAIGYAYLAVGVVSTVAFLATEPALGIQAAAVGLAAGGVWLAAVLGAVLRRRGWRAAAGGTGGVVAMLGVARQLALASVIFMSQTLLYVVCVAVASRLGEGEATVFAYAYMTGNILLGLTANVSAVLRSPSIVASANRVAEAAAVGISTFRFTLVLAGPLLGIALLAGQPVLAAVLGSDFDGTAASSIVGTLFLLTGWITATAAGLFAIVELLARNELRRLAGVAALQVAVLAVAAPVGGALLSTPGIAGALSLASLSAAGTQLFLAYGPLWRDILATMVRALGRELLVLASAFGPPALLLALAGPSDPGRLVAAIVGGVLAVGTTRLGWPEESRALRRIVSASRISRRDMSTTIPSS